MRTKKTRTHRFFIKNNASRQEDKGVGRMPTDPPILFKRHLKDPATLSESRV